MSWFINMKHVAGRGTRSYPHIVGVRCTDGPIGGSCLAFNVGESEEAEVIGGWGGGRTDMS